MKTHEKTHLSEQQRLSNCNIFDPDHAVGSPTKSTRYEISSSRWHTLLKRVCRLGFFHCNLGVNLRINFAKLNSPLDCLAWISLIGRFPPNYKEKKNNQYRICGSKPKKESKQLWGHFVVIHSQKVTIWMFEKPSIFTENDFHWK